MEQILDPILLVDDEKDNLQALQRLLRGLFQVTLTTSPLEALKLISTQKFHVIVSDQRMPDMTGVELLEKAKKLCPQATRVLLTGYTDIESVIDAINRGHIYRYIAKPWDPEDLKLTLKQANEAYRLRSEVEEKNKALEKSLAELSLLDKAKARFLSLISHELNTPLTVLQSFMSLLSQSQAELSKDLQKSVSALSQAVHRFSEIVNEVLTYTRLEATDQLKFKSVDIDTAHEHLVSKLRAAAEKKKVRIQFQQGQVGTAHLDWEKMELALTRIMMAIIHRALPDSEIQMGSLKENEQVLLDIRWQGEMLPQDAFKPFETGSSEMHHHKNLGLSLALAKLIIEGHGGSISPTDPLRAEPHLRVRFK